MLNYDIKYRKRKVKIPKKNQNSDIKPEIDNQNKNEHGNIEDEISHEI